MKLPFKTGQNITRQESPRVLILPPWRWSREFTDDLAERLAATVPTVLVASSLSQENLSEWDCLITGQDPGAVDLVTLEPANYRGEPQSEWQWHQRYPPQLSLICLVEHGSSLEPLDVWPPEGGSAEIPPITVVAEHDLVGRHISYVEGLPTRLDHLVRDQLVPVVRARETSHTSFRVAQRDGLQSQPEDLYQLRPFLLGPNEQTLACSYQRSAEASAWLLPGDIPDVFPWVCEALREWNSVYPDRFPLIPEWQHSSTWYSPAEIDIQERRRVVTAEFESAFEAWRAKTAELDAALKDATELANQYERALVSAEGTLLEHAVARAFADLGFTVQEMDEVWPEGDKREDLRITIDGEDDWIAIVEVKSFKRGTKETEVVNMSRWIERYILETGTAPSARWFVTNAFRTQDPESRPTPFENKPEFSETFNKAGGTIIDTRALFDLVTITATNETMKAAARAMLKAHLTQITRVRTEDLTGFATA